MPSLATPYYRHVPKELGANLRFRREVRQIAKQGGRGAQRQFWMMCARDPLFYINTFVWTYDPRRVGTSEHPASPFITWDYQDDVLADLFAALGDHDVHIEKSRDMGASWLCLLVFEHQWHFRPLRSFLLVSWKEALVDERGDPDSLFSKLDYIHEHLPGWMLPNFTRKSLNLVNLDTSSTIDGESTTGNVGRGGRRTAIMLDEFAAVDNSYEVLAATRGNSRCRILNSTPKGAVGGFYDMREKIKTRIRLHWSLHPRNRIGLWTDPERKPYALRSPWYDEECARAAHPQEIASELEIDYLGSDYQFFDPAVLEMIETRGDIQDPYHVGELSIDDLSAEALGFTEIEGGRLKLWIHPDAHGQIVRDRGFSIGADVSAGTGASNSALCVLDKKTGEKVAEFACPYIKASELAKYALGLARWFVGQDGDAGGAFVIWEANGHGRDFGDKLLELGYRNIFFRVNEKTLRKKASDIPGWYSTRENKLTLISEYRRAAKDGDFIQRSALALGECRQYVFTKTGCVEHGRAMRTPDPSGARDNHGDRVIADALAWHGSKMRPQRPAEPQDPPTGSFMARRRERQREAAAVALW